MKKSLYINRSSKNYNLSDLYAILKKHYTYIEIYILFVSGLIIGTAITHNSAFIRTVITNLISLNDGFLTVFIRNIFVYFSIYLALFISGFSCIGKPFIMCIPVLSGVFYSALLTSFIENIPQYGLIFFLLAKLPSAIIFINTVFIMTEISGIMSDRTKTAVFSENNASIQFKEYIISFLLILIFGIISAAIDSVISFFIYRQ